MKKYIFYIYLFIVCLSCNFSLTEEKQAKTILFDTLIHAGDQYDYSIQSKYSPVHNAATSENDTRNYEAVFDITQYNGDDEIEFRSEPLQKEFFSKELPEKLLENGFLTQPRIVEIDKSHDKILFETSVKIPGTSVEKNLLFFVMISGKLRPYSE